jgi:AcrR family transcriptional regulator
MESPGLLALLRFIMLLTGYMVNSEIYILAHIWSRKPAMNAKKSRQTRRQPRQRRAHETVEAVLGGAVRILKREGVRGLTTNRIAEVAGVSIGSVYQYFPDKAAIFSALHQRHIAEIDRLVAAQLTLHAESSLGELMHAMIGAMVDVHAADPELGELLMTEVPHRSDGGEDFSRRLHGAFRLAIAARTRKKKKFRNLDKTVFTVAQMVDALSHGAALRRPAGVSLAEAKEEAYRAVMAYLEA